MGTWGNFVGKSTLDSGRIFYVELLNCIFSSSETTSNSWTNVSGLQKGNYHPRQLTPCSEIIHAWWEPIWNIFILEDCSQRTRAECTNISAWNFPGPGQWKSGWLRGLVASSTTSPPTHLSPCDLAVCKATSQQHKEGSLHYSCPSPCFPLRPQGQTGAFRRHGCVQRSLPNHDDIWSTSPCYPAEGQMGTACLPLTGAGPSKGMQTLSSMDVFKILLSLWTSMECVTLPTDCAIFQPSSFYDITHFNYFCQMPFKNPTIKTPEHKLSSSFA